MFYLFLVLGFQQVHASWSPFGPEGIQVNRICFNLDMQSHCGICHDGGLCLYDPVSQTWTDHSTILPVTDACYLDGDKILVVMGNGSYSYGIYHYDPGSDEFELIQFVDSPFFIRYSEYNQTYYVGHYMELLKSTDGYLWTPVDTFINRTIVTMDTYENHFVVSEMDNLYGVWYSNDAGISWTLSAYSPMINSLGYDHEGKLYGTFPDNSYSSGLWSSTDFGVTWDVEFWSVGLNCVGFDYPHVFVGWGEDAYAPYKGIAWFHPENHSLTFINANLPNLVINQITHNPAMSAIALFCCTENGAYVSYDYYLGTQDQNPPRSSFLSLQPNPATTLTVISFYSSSTLSTGTLTLYTLTGNVVWQTEADLSSGKFHFDCSPFLPGIYLIELTSSAFYQTAKLILH